MKQQQFRWAWVALLSAAAMTGCGGGGSSAQSAPAPSPSPSPSPSSAPTATSVSAATTTASTNANCVAVEPFYWEIGDGSTQKMASGQVGGTNYNSTTQLEIASASKWVYASYVVQQHSGVTPTDLPFLNFTSGYDNMGNGVGCPSLTPNTFTVSDCLALSSNSVKTAADVGAFSYDSGHMQNHAAQVMNLGSANIQTLATQMQQTLGITVSYVQPLLAGGIVTSTDEYATFLQKIIRGDLKMHDVLGTNAVCTNPADPQCSNRVVYSPTQGTSEMWHYSIGHWVEDDGAFSSAGAFGYYPWIDKNKQYYGVLARHASSLSEQEGLASALCGSKIRLAWQTGQVQ